MQRDATPLQDDGDAFEFDATRCTFGEWGSSQEAKRAAEAAETVRQQLKDATRCTQNADSQKSSLRGERVVRVGVWSMREKCQLISPRQ